MKRALFAFAILVSAIVSPALAQPNPPPLQRPVAFAELTLGHALAEAVKHSPDVAAAHAAVAENAAALSVVRSSLGPSLVSSYVLAPQANAVPVPASISQRITSVGVQTTIGDAFAFAPNLSAADATLRSAQAALTAAERAERVKVIGLYYDALKALAIDRARGEAVRVARLARAAAALRVRAGDAPRLDLIRADVTLARAVAAAETAHATMQNTAQALRVESGVAAHLETTVDGPFPRDPNVSPEEAAALLMRTSPELRAAAASSAAARSTAIAAGRAILPAVTLGAGYARGIDSGVEVSGPTVNVALIFPLSGGAFSAAAQKRAAAAQVQAKQEALARQLVLDVSAAARNLSASHRATAASFEARTAAQSELDATTLGYANGASSSLELAAAEDTLTQAVLDELSSLYDELKARDVLNVELGT